MSVPRGQRPIWSLSHPQKVLVAQSCPTLCDPMDCSLPGSSVHGISQARILEWVAIPFSRGSSRPRDQTLVSCIAGRCFTLLQNTTVQWKKLCVSFARSRNFGRNYFPSQKRRVILNESFQKWFFKGRGLPLPPFSCDIYSLALTQGLVHMRFWPLPRAPGTLNLLFCSIWKIY